MNLSSITSPSSTWPSDVMKRQPHELQINCSSENLSLAVLNKPDPKEHRKHYKTKQTNKKHISTRILSTSYQARLFSTNPWISYQDLRMLSCEIFMKTKNSTLRATPRGCHGTQRETPVLGLWKSYTFRRAKPI